MIAAVPLRRQRIEQAAQSRQLLGSFGEGEGFAARQFEQFAVAQGMGDVEAALAVLAGAEEFAGAAQFEVEFGEAETVRRFHERVEPLLGLFGQRKGGNQDAVRFFSSAANPTAQLVELRESE